MEQVKLINKRLLDYFGPAPNSDSKALFRVVWPEGLTEVRVGLFDKFTESGIFLGSEEGAQEQRKYSWVKERWILEVYKASNILSSAIVKQGDGYEPIWIFNKDGEYQPLWWPAIEKLCKDWISSFIHPERKNDKIIDSEEADRVRADEARIEETLDITPLQLAFRKDVGEAILLPGKSIDWKG